MVKRNSNLSIEAGQGKEVWFENPHLRHKVARLNNLSKEKNKQSKGYLRLQQVINEADASSPRGAFFNALHCDVYNKLLPMTLQIATKEVLKGKENCAKQIKEQQMRWKLKRRAPLLEVRADSGVMLWAMMNTAARLSPSVSSRRCCRADMNK